MRAQEAAEGVHGFEAEVGEVEVFEFGEADVGLEDREARVAVSWGEVADATLGVEGCAGEVEG